MGHQDWDGEKVGQMSLFDWKLEAAMDREKQKFIHFQVLLSFHIRRFPEPQHFFAAA